MKNDNELLEILDKVILYIIFFVLCAYNKHIFHWFMNMENMTYAMILMSVVMIVNFGWELVHAKL